MTVGLYAGVILFVLLCLLGAVLSGSSLGYMAQRVQERGAQRNPKKVLQSIALLPFYGPAWLLGKGGRILWAVLSWVYDSFVLGIQRGWYS